MTLAAFAPAKINLSLHVGRPRRDGRHPLESVAAFANVGDEVRAELSDGLSLRLSGPFGGDLAAEPDNLVLRAARALAEEADVRADAALTLDKHLPIASGIGGGSADAAAALRVLAQLWNVAAAPSDLERIGARLGADVPACVRARGCFMTGTGETLSPLGLAALDVVLVNPRVSAPTGAVYRAFDGLGGGEAFAPSPAPEWRDGAAMRAGLAAMRNDLTAAACEIAPAIARVIAALETHSELVRLSGSGATVWAAVEDGAHAAALARDVTKAHPHWWVRAARLDAIDVQPRAV